jgi:ribosome-associated translation inhibitor RaiA
MSINYIFRYHGTSSSIYGESKEDFEEQFASKLTQLEDLNKIQIDAVHFNFDYEVGHDQKYTLEISLDSPDLNFSHKEEGKDPIDITHISIDALLRFVRKEKEKRNK